MTRQKTFLLSIICCLPTALKADIIVDVQDASIAIGSSATVDVLISSTGTDDFDFASYVFGITDVGTPSAALEFIDPQTTTEGSDGNYLFAADLDAGALDFFVNDPSEVEGFDGTASFAPITLDGTQRLLARLDLGFGLGGTPTLGDQYRITLLGTSAFGGSDTFFQDNTAAVDRIIDVQSFDSLGLGGGLITVTSAAATVPEPGTFAVAGLLLLGGLYSKRKRNSGNAETV